jgi:hypothetical protein
VFVFYFGYYQEREGEIGMEILEYVLGSFWRFCGFLIILCIIGDVIKEVALIMTRKR